MPSKLAKILVEGEQNANRIKGRPATSSLTRGPPQESAVDRIVEPRQDFAAATAAADARSPVAINLRTGVSFQPGIGPNSESRTVRLAVAEMQSAQPERYAAVGSVYFDCGEEP
jgi:hypothetical protein